MAAITVRNLSDETHRALKARAVAHGRSTEAEVRSILDAAVSDGPKLGSILASIGQDVGGVDLDLVRDQGERAPLNFP